MINAPHFVGAIHESPVLRGEYLPRFGRYVKRPYDGVDCMTNAVTERVNYCRYGAALSVTAFGGATSPRGGGYFHPLCFFNCRISWPKKGRERYSPSSREATWGVYRWRMAPRFRLEEMTVCLPSTSRVLMSS